MTESVENRRSSAEAKRRSSRKIKTLFFLKCSVFFPCGPVFMARILGWTNLHSAPLQDLSQDFWINSSSGLCEMHHVSNKLIRFSFNDCTTSPGRKKCHLLIFATLILDHKMLLSLTKFPIVHRRQDFSQSTPTNETLGLLRSMTVTFSEPQIKFENSRLSTASS